MQKTEPLIELDNGEIRKIAMDKFKLFLINKFYSISSSLSGR